MSDPWKAFPNRPKTKSHGWLGFIYGAAVAVFFGVMVGVWLRAWLMY